MVKYPKKEATAVGRKLFCDISPACYKISVWKCCRIREIKDFFSREKFAAQKSSDLLPNVVKGHTSVLCAALPELTYGFRKTR